MPEAGFLDIAVGGSSWLDFDITENQDGTWSLSWQGRTIPDFESETTQLFDISFDIYAEDKDGNILLDIVEATASITITDVDEKPTGLTFTPVVTELAEGVYEKGVRLGTVEVKDDAQGTNTLTRFRLTARLNIVR